MIKTCFSHKIHLFCLILQVGHCHENFDVEATNYTALGIQ